MNFRTPWLTGEGRFLARVRCKATCYIQELSYVSLVKRLATPQYSIWSEYGAVQLVTIKKYGLFWRSNGDFTMDEIYGRYITNPVHVDLKDKIVFVGGPIIL